MDEEFDKKRLRELAKKRMEGKQPAEAASEKDASELIEELSTHQEELNIQNEELLRVQHELEATRAKYFELYDLAPVGYLTLTPELIIKESNLAGSTILGTERKNLIDRRLSTFISPSSQESLHLHYRRLAQGKERQLNTFSVQRKNGKELYVQFESNLVEGGPSSGFRSILTDITDIRRAQREAEEEHSRLQSILDNMPVSVAVVDASGQVLIRNKMMNEFLGHLPYSEDISEYGRFHGYRHGTDIPLRPEEWPVARSLLTGKIVNNEELDIQSGNGPRTIWLSSSMPIWGENGKITGGIAVFTDITKQKELESELRRSNAELQQFAYVASHDLQEPLRMIMSYLALLNKKHGDELNAQAKGYMAYVVDGAERMRWLIDDLLQFSRIDTQIKPFSDVDLNLVAKNAIDTMHVKIAEIKAEVILGPLPTVFGDETQLSQVIQNLISNAVKFHGNERPRVEVSSRQNSREYIIAVKDNGIGIDPKYFDKLFQMFQRLHTKEKYPGTGIGLAISKKIVERHGGRIWVESDGKNGSTFLFTIPKKGGTR